jgi:hypothetical protein
MPSLPSSGYLIILPLGNFCWCSETATNFFFKSTGKSVKRVALLKQATGECFVIKIIFSNFLDLNQFYHNNFLL